MIPCILAFREKTLIISRKPYRNTVESREHYMTDVNYLQKPILRMQSLVHRVTLTVLIVPFFCIFADASLASDNDMNPSAHVTSIKQWEPGLVQGHEGGKFLYYNLPEFIANIDTNGKQASYVKLRATLEASTKADVDAIDADMPRIRDSFSAYLRSLHPNDMTSPKLTKIRAELLKGVNRLIAPHRINNVLFEELLVQ